MLKKRVLLHPAGQIPSLIADCFGGVSLLGSAETIDRRVAHHFIKNSAYWQHPRADWIRAPKHADRISIGAHGWEISFGANKFLVELAIKKYISVMSKFLSIYAEGTRVNYSHLLIELGHVAPRTVANFDDQIYPSPYQQVGNNMLRFGTQGIRSSDLVEIAVRAAKLPQYFEIDSEQEIFYSNILTKNVISK